MGDEVDGMGPRRPRAEGGEVYAISRRRRRRRRGTGFCARAGERWAKRRIEQRTAYETGVLLDFKRPFFIQDRTRRGGIRSNK
jgi:hypothetical protein